MKERVNFPVSSQLGGCFVVTRGLLTINLLFWHLYIDTVGVRGYDEAKLYYVCPFNECRDRIVRHECFNSLVPTMRQNDPRVKPRRNAVIVRKDNYLHITVIGHFSYTEDGCRVVEMLRNRTVLMTENNELQCKRTVCKQSSSISSGKASCGDNAINIKLSVCVMRKKVLIFLTNHLTIGEHAP